MNLHRSEISRRWAAILARLKETRHIIALSVFLILSMWYLFGAVNITIPTVISLLYIFKYQQAFRLRDVLRISLRMTVLCGAAIVCWVNLPLCILGNLAVPLGLVYSLSDRFTPKAYYIYVMEFVFLEMLPVSGSAILTRFFALFYGLLVFAAAFYCYARRAKRRRHYGTVRKGMKTLATQLENRALGTPDDGLAQTLATLCAHMSHVVYTSRNTRFLATGYGKINYLFLLFFQRMAYCLAHFFPAGQTLAPQDASYLRQLSCLLAALETKLDPPHSQQLLRRLQFLQDTCALSSPAGTEAMAEALALRVDALEEMAHTPMDQAMTHWPLLSEERKTLDGLFQFHRFQSRFAIRLAVVLCLSFTFVYLTQWPFAYWYPMTVFLMLMPYAEESAARINNRVLGNLLGLLMTALLLSLFHSLPAYVFLVALMTCLMYYVPLTSTSMSTYGTCYGMILAILLVDIRLAIGLRLAYVAMAAVTAWTANRFLFPITEPGQVRDSLQTLLETDARMLAELQEMLSSNSSRHSFRQYLIRSNMLTQEMETLLAGSPSTAAHTLLLHLLPLQRKLSTELELLASYVHDHPGRFLPEQRGELRTLFSSLQKTLQALEQGSSPAPVPAPLPSLSKEQVYFHTLLSNCVETLEDTRALLLCRFACAERAGLISCSH